jgi:hypothetical protein
MSEEPIRVFLGVFPIKNAVTIPAEVLRAADAEIEAERARRHKVAEEAQAATDAAAARKTWRGRLRAMFWRKP